MMKKQKLLRSFLPILLLIFLLGGCNKSEDAIQAYTDAVFIKKKIDNDTLTSIAFYVYSNKSLTSAEVTLPEGETVVLEGYLGSSYTFYSEPDNEDYTKDSPADGAYHFTLTSADGEVLEVNDDQEFYDLGFAEIDSMSFDAQNYWLYIEWNEVTGSDGYVAKLFDNAGELVYTSPANSATYAYISGYNDTGTWYSAPTKGETYTLMIQSEKFDSNATDASFLYNIQEISYSTHEITWELD